MNALAVLRAERRKAVFKNVRPIDCVMHPADDEVRPLTSEEVAEAIESASKGAAAATPEVSTAPTEQECIALARSMFPARFAEVQAFLADAGVKRVPDLTPEQRRRFVDAFAKSDAA